MDFHYDFKEGCYIDIPLWDAHLYSDEYLKHAKKDLSIRAMASVAEHAMGEHGVNVKLYYIQWEHNPFGIHPTLRLGVVAYLSFPKEHVMKMEEFDFRSMPSIYHCPWCGAKDPIDDKYHSGTCENCGGPKL